MITTATVRDVVEALDRAFPLATQDDWDNSGLIVGNAAQPLKGILLTLDITPAVVEEAIAQGCNMVVAHHPILFRGTKRLTNANNEQRLISLAIKNDIALFAAHTCADKSLHGTSARIAEMLHMANVQILVPEERSLFKVVTYVPVAHAEAVRRAMLDAGAGNIGNYSHCSYNLEGQGSFKAGEGANPFVGAVGEMHFENETRIETIAPKHLLSTIIKSMLAAHPYEEPAYDIFPLENRWNTCGYGVVGDLPEEMSVEEFLLQLRQTFDAQGIRHTAFGSNIKRVAICTGSGGEFVGNALAAGAQAYISADIKYHTFGDFSDRILIADIGHYESEQICKQLFLEVLREKFSNFAIRISTACNNPVKYF